MSNYGQTVTWLWNDSGQFLPRQSRRRHSVCQDDRNRVLPDGPPSGRPGPQRERRYDRSESGGHQPHQLYRLEP